MDSSIRVLLVDDHSIVRFGYQQLLSQNPAIEVVAEAENCAEALSCYRKLAPDVVILDLSMPMDSESEEVQETFPRKVDAYLNLEVGGKWQEY
ncbi:response regulator transcription factor [Marinobacterium sp. D7]|uniref:response regulator transcription factor n=1 Tax=Marinobacterium ramblicola TaxID=2849041 RepID=UPI001C2D9C37|nr:response regulator transcription factor [Marinobacterium ramblicola]MBV1789928.1 response regulator transcription factor [Marinobacterium ramblicola]